MSKSSNWIQVLTLQQLAEEAMRRERNMIAEIPASQIKPNAAS